MKIKKHLIATFLLLALDLTWVTVYFGKRYQNLVQQIQHAPLQNNFLSALLAYVCLVLALNFLVLPHTRKQTALRDAFRYGFLFGIFTYGAYDFTCGAIFLHWDFALAFQDIVWGGLLFFVSTYFATRFGE